MKHIFFIMILVSIFRTIHLNAQDHSLQNQQTSKSSYQCPMKCEGEKTYPQPGKCPVCGMEMTKLAMVGNNSNGVLNSEVHLAGAMRNVMMKGDLQSMIELDTISNKSHLYGFGPLEYLTGEVLIIDGKCYAAKVINGSNMKVSESFSIKAPFFAYANISQWREVSIPDSILTDQQLEIFLNEFLKDKMQPTLFRLTAIAKKATIHVVNLPRGTSISSPEDSHKGQVNFIINNALVEVIGFYSKAHKSIFTHHDTNMHSHLITHDNRKVGHLDSLRIQKGTAKLYFPAN